MNRDTISDNSDGGVARLKNRGSFLQGLHASGVRGDHKLLTFLAIIAQTTTETTPDEILASLIRHDLADFNLAADWLVWECVYTVKQWQQDPAIKTGKLAEFPITKTDGTKITTMQERSPYLERRFVHNTYAHGNEAEVKPFVFEFRAWLTPENEMDYKKALDIAYKEYRQAYLAEVNKSVLLTEDEVWVFIRYQVLNHSQAQIIKSGIDRKTVVKSVNRVVSLLDFTLRKQSKGGRRIGSKDTHRAEK